MIAVSTNAHKVSTAIGLYIAETGAEERAAVRMASRGVTRNLLHMTPPFHSPSPLENFGIQKTVGEGAVERDLSRAFKPLENLLAFTAPKNKRVLNNFRAALNKHDPVTMATLLTSLRYPNITPDRIVEEASVARHDELRKNGRVPKNARAFFIFKAASYDTLEDQLTHGVGRGKSGWLAAANALGISVPAWIARHGEPGNVTDRSQAYSDPSFHAVNTVDYMMAFAGESRLVDMAMQLEANALLRALEAKRKGLWGKRR